MYHVHCTIASARTLNPSKMKVTPSFWMSGTAYPVMHLHILNTRIFFYVLVYLNFCKPAEVHRLLCYVMLYYVMLCYVCKHVYIYVSWNYSCCQRQFNLFFSFVAKIDLH